jgi:phosphoglycerate dehydrogenase-like enzyme
LLAKFPDIQIRSLHHNAGPTAELALGLVLSAARGLVPADSLMRRQDWTTRFTPPQPCMLLDGYPATVLGYGAVGRRVARGLAALGMRVRATRQSAVAPYAAEHAKIYPSTELPNLLPDTRVLVLCLPAEQDTIGLIGADELALLPDPAVLVNVSRAAIVAEAALYDKLKSGSLAAGIDVWPTEATDPDAAQGLVASRLPFHELPNVVLSPHRGGAFNLPEIPGLRAAYLEEALAALAVGKEPALAERSAWPTQIEGDRRGHRNER